MAAGQSLSNRRAERSSYAESRARRLHGDDGSITPLRLRSVRSRWCWCWWWRWWWRWWTHRGSHSLATLYPLRDLLPDIWRARAPRHPAPLAHRWVLWSTVVVSSSLSIPPVSHRAHIGGSPRRPTGNSRAKRLAKRLEGRINS